MKELLITIPKSGTHMITQMVQNNLSPNVTNIPYGSRIFMDQPHKSTIVGITNLSNFGRTHIPYHPKYEQCMKRNGVKAIFLYRDPRDLMVSYYFWIKKIGHTQGSSIPGVFENVAIILKSDDPFSVMISEWGMHIRRYLPWLYVPKILHITYEDLVQKSVKTAEKIAEFWNYKYGKAGEMVSRLNPATCETFRKGIVGDWKNHFTDKHISKFNDELGDVMEVLGYDED